MNYESGCKHRAPHVHVYYQGKDIPIDLDGERVVGEIPSKKLKEIRKLLKKKQVDFQGNWRHACCYEPLLEINLEEDNYED